MNRFNLLIVSIFLSVVLSAQVNKTIDITAGTLSVALTSLELDEVTNLTVTGTIDARDFKTMRDEMPVLSVLNLSGAVIAEYSGTDGTFPADYDYPANKIPDFAFHDFGGGGGKLSLTTVTFGFGITAIGQWAFLACSGLTSVNFPTSVISIEGQSFYQCTSLNNIIIPISVTSIGNLAFFGCTGLESITSQTPIPVDLSLSANVFTGVNKTTCVLNIPYEASSLYEVASQWQDFTNIVEMPGFRISSTAVGISETGGTVTADISADVTWNAGSDQGWLTVNPTSFTGNKQLQLIAEANSTPSTRFAIVTITSPGIVSQTIKITQQGEPVTVNVTPGGLFTALTSDELNTTSRLIITGSIDARDFKTMRDEMPILEQIDMEDAAIEAYSGEEGTNYSGTDFDYPANGFPLYAFYNPDLGISKFNLKSVILPSSLTSLGEWSFFACIGLTTVTIPSSVSSIADYTFLGCIGLTTIEIPVSVTFIGAGAFSGCAGLMSITTYSPIPVDLGSDTDVFLGVNKTTCILNIPYDSGILYEVADQWKDFSNILEMDGFRLSSTTEQIPVAGGNAIINITADVIWNAVSDQGWLVADPASSTGNTDLELTAEANPTVATRVANVTISSPGIVSQTIKITQDGLPKTVNIAAGGLFAALTPDERNTITRLIITGTIDARDFKTMRDVMPGLKEIDISGATIAAYSGTEGTYPDDNDYPGNTIPDYAFSNSISGLGKTSLTNIIFPASATEIGYGAFIQCTGLTSVTLPVSFVKIGASSFSECTGLIDFTFPASVTTIGEYAFENCSSLNSVSLPSTLTSIGNGVFFYCISLSSIVIPSSVSIIGNYAFYNCSSLGDIIIPGTAIGNYAFYECSNLSSVVIQSSVTFIGREAFSGCTDLTSIINNAVTPQSLNISLGVFDNVDKSLCKLFVPAGSGAAYASANQWEEFNIYEESTKQLSYRMANPMISNIAGIDYFNFDILVKSNEAGTFFWDGIISLDFNSTTLGATLADWFAVINSPFNANNSLGHTKYSADISVAGSTVNIDFKGDINASNLPASGNDFVEITTGYQTMLTLYAKITNANGVAGIDFKEAGMNGYQINKFNSVYGIYVNPNLYNADDFMDTYVARVYNGTVWTQTGGLDWNAEVNTSVWDGNATLPVGLNKASNLHIYNPATLTIPPTGKITVTGTTLIETPEGLVIESDGTGTGSLITGTALGTAKAKCWMTTGSWHQVAPILPGQSISDFLTGNANIATKDITSRGMMNYFSPTNTWSAFYTNASAGTLTAGVGYMMRTGSDAAVNFTGNISAGNQSVTLNGAGDTGWNLIGNPFSSAIDLNSGTNDFLTENTVSLDPGSVGVYIWNQGLNKYDVINWATADEVASPGQAFFVKSAADAASVSFKPEMQLHNIATLKSSITPCPEINVVAVINGVNASTGIKFITGTSIGLDPGYDAGLFNLGATVSIYTKLVEDNGSDFMLQCLPADFNNFIIPLGLNSKAGGNVTFSAGLINLPYGCMAILEDRLNNIFTDLSIDNYQTDIESNNCASGRFYIHTSSTTTGIGDLGNSKKVLKVYSFRNIGIRIEGTISDRAIATLFDLQGRAILVKNLEDVNLNIISTSGIKSGIYMLQINDNKQNQEFKIPVFE